MSKLPNHYQLVSDNPKHFVVHDTRDGKQFPIAKKDLHPAHQIHIMRLQKFSEGEGDVEELGKPKTPDLSDDKGYASAIADAEKEIAGNEKYEKERAEPLGGYGAPPALADQFNPNQTPFSALERSSFQQEQPNQSSQIPNNPVNVSQLSNINGPPAPVPQGPQNPMQTSVGMASSFPQQDPFAGTPYEGLFKGKEEAIKGMAGVSQRYQEDIARAEQRNRFNEIQLKAQSDLARNHYEGELNNLSNWLNTNEVDPNRLWHQSGIGGKIAGGLALVLGGIGAGLTHGENMGLKTINNLMEKDLDAQKANISSKQSLYRVNLQRFGDERLADQATRLQQNAILQSEIRSAAARAGAQNAPYIAQGMLSDLEMNKYMLLQQFGDTSSMNKMLGVGTGKGGLPTANVPPRLAQDPKFQERAVDLSNGMTYLAKDKEAAGKVRDVETLAGPIVEGVNKLKSLGPAALVKGTQENNMATAIMGDLGVKLPLLSGAQIGAKRVNGEEIKLQLDRIKDPRNWGEIAGGSKNDYLLNSLASELDAVRGNHLSGYQGSSRLGISGTPQSLLPYNKGK